MRRIASALFAAAFAALLVPAPAAAQYPSKPVRWIIAWPAGGPTDTIGRMVAQKLGEALGQQVLVENRPGAAGMIGSEAVARSAPDGHTLLMAVVQDVTRPALVPKIPFDVLKDLEPIIKVYDLPFIISVNRSVVPVDNLEQLIAYARERGDKFQYATPSNGSVGHLSFELLKQLAKFDATHIPYKGSAPAMQDLLGGQVPMMYGDMVSALANIRAGKIKAIAVSTAARVPVLPDVPTVAESGFPGFLGVAWGGIMVPAGTPAAIKERLYRETAKILETPDVQARIRGVGVEPAAIVPQEAFGAFMRSEMDKWGKVIRERDIRAQ